MNINALPQRVLLQNPTTSFSRIDNGYRQTVEGTKAGGEAVSLERELVNNGDHTAHFSSRLVIGDTFAQTTERTLSAEQLADRRADLNQLGTYLSRNPYTGPDGTVYDGSLLLKITA